LTWGKPYAIGGNVTEYTVFQGISINSLKPIQHLQKVYDTVVEFEVLGLDCNITYYFAVSSFNDFGESYLSPVVSVSPYGEPGVPEFTRNVTHIDSVELWWNFPNHDGGCNIIEFSIMYKKLQQTQWNIVKVSLVDYLNLEYMETGEIYQFKIKARNHFAYGKESNPIDVMIGNEPGRISDLSVEYNEGTPTLIWSKPNENGFNIQYYEIYFKDASGDFVKFRRITGTASGYALEGLEKGKVHNFAVSAVNAVGESDISQIVSIISGSKPDPVPSTWVESFGPGRITIKWSYPYEDGGERISEFNIYRGSEPGTEVIIQTVKDFNSFTDKDLINGQTYYYFVTPLNKWGEGRAGPRVSSIPMAPPSSPMDLRITSTTDTVEIKWNAPVDSGGSRILGYIIYKGSDPERMKLFMRAGPNTQKITDKDVSKGEIYLHPCPQELEWASDWDWVFFSYL
jgi:fibronectin type 3 domain-containing protein